MTKGKGTYFLFDIDINDPIKIINLKLDAVVDIGRVGHFDDNGDTVRFSAWVKHLYTIGLV